VRRRLVVPAFAAALCLLATSCELRLVSPPGSGKVRYRDAVFTEVEKTADITYGGAARRDDGIRQSLELDTYEPVGDDVTKRPVLILVHGGGFNTGTKESPELVDEANTFAKQGYLVASIEYRLSKVGCSSIGDECIRSIEDAWHDAQAAVRFFRRYASTYGVDTKRIAIAGTSAGAITALNVAYGADVHGGSGNPGYSGVVQAAVSLSGAAILTNPDPDEPPTLLFHGTKDDRVPYDWAKSTAVKAERAGDHLELVTWEGDGHVPYVKHRTEILTQTSNFLWWTLDLAHAAR
jgi:acetyl esterase/lipase